MNPLKILLMCGALTPGGIQQMVLQEAKTLVDLGHHVDICTMSDVTGELAQDAVSNGATVYTTCSPRRMIQFSRRYSEILRKGKYDVVHVQRSSHYSALPILIAHRVGVPCRVAHYQNINRGGVRSLLNPVTKYIVMRQATSIIGVSNAVLDSQFGNGWRRNEKFTLLPNSIEVNLYSKTSRTKMRQQLGMKDEQFVLGHCGRFSPAKNQRFLLELFPRVLEQIPNARLVLAGSGAMKREMMDLSERLGIREKVLFPGWKDEFRSSIYAAFDVFLMPSHWEGFGIVLLEAQASGLPCISTDLECFDGVLSPGNAQLVTPLDAPSIWLERITRLASDEEFRQKLANEARTHVQQFDNRHHVNRLLSIYTEGGHQHAIG